MHPHLPRRRFIGLAGGLLSAAALGAAGWEARRTADDQQQELVVLDEGDPLARPRVFATPGGVDFRMLPPEALRGSLGTPPAGAVPPFHSRVVERPAWSSQILRQVASHGPTGRPMVALTLDDGWSHRDEVLAVVERLHLQLTLFLAGRPIARDKAFIARALNAGCEIANHTMDHYNLTDKSAAYIQKDIDDFERLVQEQVTGATTKPYMRPSGGSLNQTVVEATAAAGYRVVLWNCSTGDGSASTPPENMVRYGVQGAQPGAIALMHFGPRAVEALPKLIEGFQAKGLETVTLSRLFEGTPSGA